MEEALTVHRLHVPMQLRKTLASTNVIEWAFSVFGRADFPHEERNESHELIYERR
jgi:hypothetical protein